MRFLPAMLPPGPARSPVRGSKFSLSRSGVEVVALVVFDDATMLFVRDHVAIGFGRVTSARSCSPEGASWKTVKALRDILVTRSNTRRLKVRGLNKWYEDVVTVRRA